MFCTGTSQRLLFRGRNLQYIEFEETSSIYSNCQKDYNYEI